MRRGATAASAAAAALLLAGRSSGGAGQVTTISTIVAHVLLQKQFERGMAAGATK